MWGATAVTARRAVAQTNILNLKMSSVMTPEELKDAGLAGLTEAQRKALDAWLNRYTETVIKITVEAKEPSLCTDRLEALSEPDGVASMRP